MLDAGYNRACPCLSFSQLGRTLSILVHGSLCSGLVQPGNGPSPSRFFLKLADLAFPVLALVVRFVFVAEVGDFEDGFSGDGRF